MTRREFLAASAGSVGVALVQSPPPKRIAAIITEHGPASDTIRPDISRPMAAKHGVPIYRTIHEALTLAAATTLPSMACY